MERTKQSAMKRTVARPTIPQHLLISVSYEKQKRATRFTFHSHYYKETHLFFLNSYPNISVKQQAFNLLKEYGFNIIGYGVWGPNEDVFITDTFKLFRA